MIVLFTDFGWNGPYVGQMKAVLQEKAPGIPVIDLMHDVPSFDTVAASYLLESLAKQFPQDTIFISVVDPGVGHPERIPYMVQADGRWFIGPDNGLFNVVEKQAEEIQRYEISWRPANLSSSFHGRDLFAPVAAMLSRWDMPENRILENREITVADDLYQVIYMDHFGNAMTGIQADSLSTDHRLIVAGDIELNYAETFSMVSRGEAFWYKNSNDLVEIAVNQGSAKELLSLEIGSCVDIG